MEPKRIVLAVALALVFAGGATYLVWRGLSMQRAAQPQTQKVVAASKPVDAGAVLSPENLVLVDWPVNLPITGGFTKIEEVSGRALIYPVADKQPILTNYLAVAGSGIGLTVKIPEGMRATSVKSNEVSGVAGFLYPGSHVDVLVSYRPPDSPSQLTQTVLQDVEVLTAGQHIEPDPQGKPETVSVVTLLLTPQDAEKIALAGQEGTIHFVLRNGADKTKVTTVPVAMPELITGQKTPPPPVRMVRVAKKEKPPDFYEVETITGDKHDVAKFKVPE
ncbi:MAG TPA: Flp pilus assembly protein CpaB [Candidatus Angelobacter sp.]|nr:Flp pilus assembly protein CpaB [Candidatus Angelobacter sp.]